MTFNPQKLARRLKRLYPKRAVRRVVEVDSSAGDAVLLKYRDDPVGFIHDVLGATLTPDQQTIARAKGRVKVNAGHSVGKTFLAACILLHRFYTRRRVVVITTAPTERDVIDLLWSQVRLLWKGAKVKLPDYFVGPRAPEMFDSEDHWAKGYTARRGESFQGRHFESMVFLFDESEAVDPIYWQTTDTMYKPNEDHLWFAIGNPITTSSQSYLEDLALDPHGNPKWDLYTLNALNHPNVHAQLAGLPPPVPNAVSLDQVEQWIADWCDKVPKDDIQRDDIQWPPNSGQWYRPGPLFKGRVLGLRPTEGVNTVWGAIAWERAISPRFDPKWCWERGYGITIGIDVAVYGDDYSTLHVRTGPLSLHHESHNGWAPERVADQAKQLCRQWSNWYNSIAVHPGRPSLRPSDVKVIVELDGPGVSVLSHNDGYGAWSGLKVAEASEMFDSTGRPMYDLKRSEMWFEAEKKAKQGKMDLSRLPQRVLAQIRTELFAPQYKLLGNGALHVESKDEVKKRLRRSPDNADGILVCYTEARTWAPEALFRNDVD